MVREGTFDSESVRPDKQKSADATTEGDNLIPVSSSGSDTSDGKFDDLMKAEFMKLVCGGGAATSNPSPKTGAPSRPPALPSLDPK